LNLLLEQMLNTRNPSQQVAAGPPLLNRWREQYIARNDRRMQLWGKPVLDELNRLEQQLKELQRPTF